jgi:hypothetical protein
MINPIGPFFVSMNGYLYNFMATNPYVGEWFFPLAFIFPTGFSLVLLWRAVVRLRLPPSAFALLLRRLAPLRAARSGLRPVGAALAAALRYLQFPARWIRNPFWLRARRARVYDREGYIGRVQWLAWFAAFLFLVLTLAFHARELRHAGASIPFLAIGWIVVLIMTVILAGSSLVGDRRRGFLDLVLMSPLTPREMIDGTLLTVWQHMRRLFWLIVVLSVFFGISGASTWSGLAVSLFSASLFCALVALYGTIFSLLSRTVPGALVPTFLFPMLMLVGIVFFLPLFREQAGPAMWIFSAVCLAVTWPWALRRPGVASVAAYFMAVHLVLTSAATCWTWQRDKFREYPIALMNPGFIALAPLEARHDDWYRGVNELTYPYGPGVQPRRADGMDKEKVLLACYWSALLINFLWVRWWAIRNFERLVERTDVPARRSLLARLLRRQSAPGVEEEVAEAVTQR